MNRRADKSKLIEIRFYGLIKELREDGLRWRKIATYLARYHRFKVNRDYLRICFSKISEKGTWSDKTK